MGYVTANESVSVQGYNVNHLSQSPVTLSHNLLTIMYLTLHLFTGTFTLKENPCNYTLVLFIHQVELRSIQKTHLRTIKSLDFPGEGQCKGDRYPSWQSDTSRRSPRKFYVTSLGYIKGFWMPIGWMWIKVLESIYATEYLHCISEVK